MLQARRRAIGGVWALILALVVSGHPLRAVVISSEALAAWKQQVESAKSALARQAANPERLLRSKSGMTKPGVSAGDPTIPVAFGDMSPVPSGLIHHWTGDIVIPHAETPDVLALLQDYDSYSELYKPAVLESRLLSRNQQEYEYRLKFVQRGFGVRTGLVGRFRTTYTQLTADAGYSVTESTDLIELENPGTPNEKPIAPEAASGYVQQVFTIVRYRQVGTGVHVQVEALTLSRGIPSLIRWVIAPLVQRFSSQTISASLENLRDRVHDRQPLASRRNP